MQHGHDEKPVHILSLPILDQLVFLKKLIISLPDKEVMKKINLYLGSSSFFEMDAGKDESKATLEGSWFKQNFEVNLGKAKELCAAILHSQQIDGSRLLQLSMINFHKEENRYDVLTEVIKELDKEIVLRLNSSEEKHEAKIEEKVSEIFNEIINFAGSYSPAFYKSANTNKTDYLNKLASELKSEVKEQKSLACFYSLTQAITKYLVEKNIGSNEKTSWDDINDPNGKKKKSHTIKHLIDGLNRAIDQVTDIPMLEKLHYILSTNYLEKMTALEKHLSCNYVMSGLSKSDERIYRSRETRSIIASMDMLFDYINKTKSRITELSPEPVPTLNSATNFLEGAIKNLRTRLNGQENIKLFNELSDMTDLHLNVIGQQRRAEHISPGNRL